jgi:hypothetical protein
MGKIYAKNSDAANVEAIGLVNVNLDNGDYLSRSSDEHFGLILPAAASIKITTTDGSTGIFPLPAGWNPVAAKRVYQVGSEITQFVAYY